MWFGLCAISVLVIIVSWSIMAYMMANMSTMIIEYENMVVAAHKRQNNQSQALWALAQDLVPNSEPRQRLLKLISQDKKQLLPPRRRRSWWYGAVFGRKERNTQTKEKEHADKRKGQTMTTCRASAELPDNVPDNQG